MSAEFLSLSRAYSILYARSLEKSRFALVSRSRKEFLIRNQFGKLTVQLFFDLSKELSATKLIECGANDASVSKRFINEAPGRSATAIEASPFVYENFKNTNISKGLTYIQVGLSNKKSVIEFNIPKVTDESTSIFGSFQKLPQYYSEYSSVPVKVEKLDTVMNVSAKMNAPTVMWVDVEGEAFKVLQGASKTLANENTIMIYIEVQESTHYKSERRAIEIVELLESFGFVPVARDFPLADLYNLLLIKQGSLTDAVPSLNRYWASLSAIKTPIIEFRKPSQTLSNLKRILLRFIPEMFWPTLHRFFALFGSKSSQKLRN